MPETENYPKLVSAKGVECKDGKWRIRCDWSDGKVEIFEKPFDSDEEAMAHWNATVHDIPGAIHLRDATDEPS